MEFPIGMEFTIEGINRYVYVVVSREEAMAGGCRKPDELPAAYLLEKRSSTFTWLHPCYAKGREITVVSMPSRFHESSWDERVFGKEHHE